MSWRLSSSSSLPVLIRGGREGEESESGLQVGLNAAGLRSLGIKRKEKMG
jgi:hypothetical protein